MALPPDLGADAGNLVAVRTAASLALRPGAGLRGGSAHRPDIPAALYSQHVDHRGEVAVRREAQGSRIDLSLAGGDDDGADLYARNLYRSIAHRRPARMAH